MDFKIKAITREEGGHYIMIKRSIQEENKTIIKLCICINMLYPT